LVWEASVPTQLSLDGLCFSDYGPIDLKIGAGECVTLTGASGSGKTLLLRAIADLDPHTGKVSVGEVECASVEAPEWRRRVGLLLAESQWWRDLVGGHLEQLVGDWLGRLGFGPEVLEWPVARLSTGERQRLALLRLLSNRPQALLIDESTANLDADNVEKVEDLVEDYRDETGAAVLWVTHDPAQAQRIGSRRYRMQDGRLILERLK
jgi:ABC-type iron transport system FetAB ATPase subunit